MAVRIAAVLAALVVMAGAAEARVGLPNPASVNCAEQGGRLEIRKRGDGGEYGVCVFPGGGECEEWALFRGQCPRGGVDVSGHRDGSVEGEARAYCLMTGGTLRILDAPAAICCRPEGGGCPAQGLYNGTCR